MANSERLTYTGLVVVGAAAAVMSFAALSGLAGLAGVTGHFLGVRLSWLLPIAVDAYAATSTGVWLRAGVSPGTKAWARANALAAIAASVAGNAIFHELTAGPSARTWVVVIVAAVPPLMLGAAVHTAVLVSEERRPVPSVPAARPATGTRRAPAPGPDREERDRAGATETTGTAGTTSGTAVSRPGPGDQEPGPVASPAAGPAVGPDPVRRLELVGTQPAASHRNGGGEAQRSMREYWDQERAAGRTPSGAQLDQVAGTKDYGRRMRRQWLAENEHGEPATAEAGR